MRFDWVSLAIGNGDSPTILNLHMQTQQDVNTGFQCCCCCCWERGNDTVQELGVHHTHLAPALYTVLFVTIPEDSYGQDHDSINLTRKCGMNRIYTSKPTTHKTGFLFSLACVLCENSIWSLFSSPHLRINNKVITQDFQPITEYIASWKGNLRLHVSIFMHTDQATSPDSIDALVYYQIVSELDRKRSIYYLRGRMTDGRRRALRFHHWSFLGGDCVVYGSSLFH